MERGENKFWLHMFKGVNLNSGTPLMPLAAFILNFITAALYKPSKQDEDS